MTAAAIFVALIALLLAGVDIAFVLAGLGAALLLLDGVSGLVIAQALMSSMDNFVLLAVPLFILMSNVLLRGGAGARLFAAVQCWVGHWPGGLAVATILSCALFAAISGSSVATAATIGTVAIPELVARGYRRRFVFGLLAAGGTLGVLIPPSIPMIVYGFLTEESIIDLFLAGIGPGLLLTALFVGWAVVHARLGGHGGAVPRAGREERRRRSLDALPTLVLAVAVVAGIYAGVFTPTEAAAVGFVLALVIVLGVHRSLRLRDLPAVARDSMRTAAMVLFIVAGAKVFGHAIALYQVPQEVTRAAVAAATAPEGFVAAVCALLLVMGCVLETLSMMLLMLPIIDPSLDALGIDPIWFGVIFTLMIECALITPPVGLNLFVIRAVAAQSLPEDGPEATVGEVVRGAAPFVALILLTAVIVAAFPGLALFIPFG